MSFGQVAMLVKLHPAIREKRIRLHLLHRGDLVKLNRQMVCSLDGAPVPPQEQTRGLEVNGGKYLLVDPVELEKADPEASRTIQIREFVPAADIDPVFLERGYLLEPGEGSRSPGRGYAALAAALEEMRLAGICTWTMRKRSYFGALVSAGKLLRLNTLRHAGEVLSFARPKAASDPPTARELKAGSELIRHMSGQFQPEKFENRHEVRLQELIDRKTRGQKILVRRPKRRTPTMPSKLLEVLEASLKRVA